jgi:hypothetical protein
MGSEVYCRYWVGADSLLFAQPDFDDSTWAWGNQTFIGPQNGEIAWFRCYVAIPNVPKENGLVLDLGRVADEDQTYFNGIEIGNSRMLAKSEWPVFFHRDYFVGSDLLINADRAAVVAVRTTTRSFGTVGFIDHPPALKRSWSYTYSIIYEFIPFVFIIIFISLMRLYPFNSELSKTKLRTLTQMGIGIATVILFNTFLLYRYFFLLSNIWLRFHFIATAVAATLIFRFVHLILRSDYPLWLTGWTMLSVIAALSLPGFEVSSWSSTWIVKFFGVMGVPILS